MYQTQKVFHFQSIIKAGLNPSISFSLAKQRSLFSFVIFCSVWLEYIYFSSFPTLASYVMRHAKCEAKGGGAGGIWVRIRRGRPALPLFAAVY